MRIEAPWSIEKVFSEGSATLMLVPTETTEVLCVVPVESKSSTTSPETNLLVSETHTNLDPTGRSLYSLVVCTTKST